MTTAGRICLDEFGSQHNANADAVLLAAVARYVQYLKWEGRRLLRADNQCMDDFLLVFSRQLLTEANCANCCWTEV